MHNQRVRRAIVLAAAGVLLAAAAVFADTIKADGDVLTTNIDSLVDLGPVSPGTVVHVDVAFQLDCSGSNKHLDANQSVTLTLGSRTVPLGGDASATSAVINPPGSSWPVDGTGCPFLQSPLRSATNSHVTITAPMTLGIGKLYTLSYTRTISPSNPNDTGTFSGSTNVSFSLDVVPNTPPVLSLPNDITAEATASSGATVTYTASAIDAEDNPDPAPVCAPASGSRFSLGTTTVSCTVSDSAGAPATGTFRVTVVDTTPPTMSAMPADQSLVTNDPAGAAVSYTAPTATDIVDPNASVSCTPASGSVVPVGYTEIRCTASDASGNSVSGHFGVTVHRNAAPHLSLPADMTVQGDAPGGSTVQFVASATDAEDQPAPTPTCSAASPSFFKLGATTVSCDVADSNGLTASGTFMVTVIDTAAPTIGTVDDVTVSTTNRAGAKVSFTMPSATDVVDAKPSVSCSPASGSVVGVGDSIGTCTATDSSGNTSSTTFAISVQLNAAPVLVVPANINVEGNTTGGRRVSFAVSATDAEDNPDPTPSCSRASGSLFAVGTTTVSCEVTDADGQRVSDSFTVKVNDTTAPTLSGGTGGLSLTTSNQAGATITYTAPSADDIVDASPSVSCNPASGSVAPLGDSFVNCTATDNSGNTATSRIPVHIVLLSTDNWSATWEEPIGPPAQVTANAGRTLPVKLHIYRNGTEVTTGTAFMRLVPCVAGAGTTVELPLSFGGRWTGKIDTSMLAGDCFRVVVIANGTEAGSFRLDLAGATPVKAPSKGPAKTAKP